MAAFGPEGFDIGALKRAVAHEFDFLGPWVDVAVEEQRARTCGARDHAREHVSEVEHENLAIADDCDPRL